MRFYFEMHGRAWPFSNCELTGGILIIVFDPQMRPCSELGQSLHWPDGVYLYGDEAIADESDNSILPLY